MRMGVVADDLTGSHDIGIMFAKAGYATDVHTFERGAESEIDLTASHVCVLNTSSRLDSPAVTYAKAQAATRALQGAGCGRFFAKTSSAFVGPVGAQFDAVLDALGEEFAIVVVGFPKNGRTTVDGIHYVHGKKLEESEFRNDPVHPMTRSSLVDILQSQTMRSVGLIDHRVIARGPAALGAALEAMRGSTNYVILDVVNHGALRTIAQAADNMPVVCGSSAIAEELPGVWGPLAAVDCRQALPGADRLGVLCAAGSMMPQTADQIRHMQSTGAAAFQLNTLALFDSRERESELERLSSAATSRLQHRQNVIVHSPNNPEMVARTRETGKQYGKSTTEVSRLVSEMLAQVVASIRARSGVNRLIVAGGETSAAVCARLGVRSMRILKEIQPGLASCLALNTAPLLLVLKSGSFGSADFCEQAIEHLQGLH